METIPGTTTMETFEVLDARKAHISVGATGTGALACERPSLAGSVSQRACTFCGSRVVLYPIADALHLVHGPIGCAAYTWDIRGALSSGPQLHRMSFCTDIREIDVIHGGEKKLREALIKLIERFQPKAAFVYATCITGLIGDDIAAVCKAVALLAGIPVLPVMAEGFKGTKKDGYAAACNALAGLIGTEKLPVVPRSVNIIGDFNVAGETWLLRSYFERIGLTVIAQITGDGRVDDIRKASGAALNIVQCSGSMMYLAKELRERFSTPLLRVSFFGLDDVARALYDISDFFGDPALCRATASLVRAETDALVKGIAPFREKCRGARAGVYVGGAFKAISLVKALRMLGIETVLAGTQTGNKADYETLREVCGPKTVIVDDANPIELAGFIKQYGINLLIGGVKERPIAYKLGVGFCDHNHERKVCLAGFSGMLDFAREVCATVTSPVWKFALQANEGARQ
jgi:nitrogenase molybdenum-cofactor synthesis protein NifE